MRTDEVDGIAFGNGPRLLADMPVDSRREILAEVCAVLGVDEERQRT
jgi:hypothetical protein